MSRRFIIAIIILGIVATVGVIAGRFLPIAIWQEPPGSNVEHSATNGVTIETVAEGLEAPWSIDFTSTGHIFFTERPGLVRLVNDGKLQEDPVLELFDSPSDEGGTLGLAVDPNFETNQYVYVYYTTRELTNRVARYRFNGEQLVEAEPLIEDIPGDNIHNGGRIAFGPGGLLHVGTGDAHMGELAQEKDSLAGKILRLEPDGSIPPDNPDPDSPVYSLGHRNVQGLSWSQDDELYATEHGPQAHDEVNRIEPGANYGWPLVEGHVNLGPRADAPVADYQNPAISSGDVTWAPSGATFYTGDVLPREWQGTFLFAGLRSQAIWRYDPDTDRLENLFDHEYGRLRDIQQGPDGNLYILTSNRDGRGDPAADDDRLLRIMPSDNADG